MITTVLEIEREAETLLSEAENEARKIVSDAREARERASKAAREAIIRQIADLEVAAARQREAAGKELAVAGESALARIRNLPPAAIDRGVDFILGALAAN
jgi:F0F1-type ATP synthase membrane subunit b/b'